MFSFQGASESQLRDSMKFLPSKELQSISLVEISGIEPLTSCLQGRRSPSWAKPPYPSSLFLKWWAKMDSNHRPHDYQSCALASWAIGPYLVTSSCLGTFLSVPSKLNNVNPFQTLCTDLRTLQTESRSVWSLLRKEVIQPHLPIRLPCYDFTPITGPTFGRAPLAVRLRTSGVPDSHGVTGGVYKARERIHRGMLIRDY